MADEIDLTLKLGKACGTCKHYRNSRNSWGMNTSLIERFKDVPDNEGIIGGYCMREEKIRLTARMALCEAYEVTTNRTMLGSFKKRICQHEFLPGCEEKQIYTRGSGYVKCTCLMIRVAYYCKHCSTMAYRIDDKVVRKTYYIYQSKTVRDLVNSRTNNYGITIPAELEMSTEDKNPDYDELAEKFSKIKIGKVFPNDFEIKETWSTLRF